MLETVMNMNPWVLGGIAYLCTVMPLIYALGGAIRKHNHCNMRTGEPLD